MIHSGNRFLSMEEMTDNANYILSYLTAKGWTKQSVCGMLGNMQTESSINPAIWESLNEGNLNGGYGLVQWTPATKYLNWCTDRDYTPSEMDSNLKRILEEVATDTQWGNNQEYGSPPYSFEEFTHSVESPYTLAMNFLWFYERPAVNNQPNRGTQANYWYETLTGEVIIDPEPNPTKKKKSNIYMYLRNRRIIIR